MNPFTRRDLDRLPTNPAALRPKKSAVDGFGLPLAGQRRDQFRRFTAWTARTDAPALVTRIVTGVGCPPFRP